MIPGPEIPDNPNTPEEEPASGLSLRDRIAARERELERQEANAIFVPLPGKEDFLGVRYRPLSFQEEIKLEKRHEKLIADNPAEGYVVTAADKLVHACQRICECNNGQWSDTEFTLDAKAARELFGRDLDEGATRRAAVRAIFKDDEDLVTHAAKYEELRQAGRQKLDGQLEGE